MSSSAEREEEEERRRRRRMEEKEAEAGEVKVGADYQKIEITHSGTVLLSRVMVYPTK